MFISLTLYSDLYKKNEVSSHSNIGHCFVGLQLKESFQHYMISKAASQNDRNPGAQKL